LGLGSRCSPVAVVAGGDDDPGSAGRAYPVAVQELVPDARALAMRLGRLPSRNQLMRELRVGARKASQLLAMLAGDSARTRLATTVAGELPAASASTGDFVTSASAVAGSGEHRSAENPATQAAAPVATVRVWPVMVLALPAFVAIWSGWVGLGGLTGFGVVHPHAHCVPS
jgi:hypothetical protein